MKFKSLFIISLFSLLNSSCGVGFDYSYDYTPLYITPQELKEKIKDKVKISSPKELINTGKIYTYKNYLFIGGENMGIHIIDNTNPQKPINKAFLNIPLNNGISIKNDVLYADSFDELLSIDISNIDNIKIINRIKLTNNFLAPKFKIINNMYSSDEISRIEIGHLIHINYNYKAIPNFFTPRMMTPSNSQPTSTLGEKSGKGGSLARFSIVGDYLYTISNRDINLFNVSDNKKLKEMFSMNVEGNSNLETIYPYKDKLFIGTATGTYIYDNTIQQNPTLISKIEHIRSCDPVVVENETAYITLRSGNSCRGGSNLLETVSLNDIKNPKVLKDYPQKKPYGLAIKDNLLFVCDYEEGLKIYDTKDPSNLKELKRIPINKPKDIIINENNLGIIVSDDGIHEYDFSGLLQKSDFKELSYIKAESVSDTIKYLNFNKADIYYRWYKEYLEK